MMNFIKFPHLLATATYSRRINSLFYVIGTFAGETLPMSGVEALVVAVLLQGL